MTQFVLSNAGEEARQGDVDARRRRPHGRFNPLSHTICAPASMHRGKLIAFHHRKACDEVTAFQDPVRFERAKGRDVILVRRCRRAVLRHSNRLGEAVRERAACARRACAVSRI